MPTDTTAIASTSTNRNVISLSSPERRAACSRGGDGAVEPRRGCHRPATRRRVAGSPRYGHGRRGPDVFLGESERRGAAAGAGDRGRGERGGSDGRGGRGDGRDRAGRLGRERHEGSGVARVAPQRHRELRDSGRQGQLDRRRPGAARRSARRPRLTPAAADRDEGSQHGGQTPPPHAASSAGTPKKTLPGGTDYTG